jgi:hypothetical protein
MSESTTEPIEAALLRARTILANMALENEGAIFNRWPINHEPLRNDARNLLPVIDAAIAEVGEPNPAYAEGYNDGANLSIAATIDRCVEAIKDVDSERGSGLIYREDAIAAIRKLKDAP